MTESDQLQWGSHLPPLFACLGATVGPVLELGVGHFSTPVLHAYCEASNRKLWSCEHDREWFEMFAGYRSYWHFLTRGEYDEVIFEVANAERWAVALIDNSPGGERRAKDFASLIDHCQYVLVHDYHRENEEAIGPLTAGLMCAHVYRTYEPPTLIASKFRNVPSGI